MFLNACSMAVFSPFCSDVISSICSPLSNAPFSNAVDVALSPLRASRFRFVKHLASSMMRSSSQASSGQDGQPETPAERLLPSKCARIRMAFPWNSFSQCAHLTSVAMPCFSGSFTTTTWFHSTPFTFTIPRPVPSVRSLRQKHQSSASFYANKNTDNRKKNTRTSEKNQNYTTLSANEHQTLITGTLSNTTFSHDLTSSIEP